MSKPPVSSVSVCPFLSPQISVFLHEAVNEGRIETHSGALDAHARRMGYVPQELIDFNFDAHPFQDT